jgi:hypothetical protein
MANGLGSYNPQAFYGTPLRTLYGQAQQARSQNLQTESAQAKFVEEERQRARLKEMQELWRQAGGDLETYKAMGGYRYFTPEQVVQVENVFASQRAAEQEALRQQRLTGAAEQAALSRIGQLQRPQYGVQPAEMAPSSGGVTPIGGLRPAAAAYEQRVAGEEGAYVSRAQAEMGAARALPQQYLEGKIKLGEQDVPAGKETEYFVILREMEEIEAVPEERRTPEQKIRLARHANKLMDSWQAKKEWERKELENVRPRLIQWAAEDPNRVYDMGFRMNDDGTVYLDENGLPKKLLDPTDVLGKRKNVELFKTLGKVRDDAMEVLELMTRHPEMRARISRDIGKPLESMTVNSLKKWIQSKGAQADPLARELIWRVEKFASDERRETIGSQMTSHEIKRITPWLPDAGDSMGQLLSKINLTAHEADEEMFFWLDMHKNTANLSDYYRAFNLDRFSRKRVGTTALDRTPGGGYKPSSGLGLPPVEPIGGGGGEDADLDSFLKQFE